jgi:uncharacterized protein
MRFQRAILYKSLIFAAATILLLLLVTRHFPGYTLRMSDIKRNLEDQVDHMLTLFPLIVILGVRQCGKTSLVKKIRPDWQYFDLERGRDYDLITGDYDLFFKENPGHLILDEAQAAPQLFNELRSVIDANRQQKGRFILTGSSSFELIRNISESLAGRAAILELGTLKMNEIYHQPLPDFYSIFRRKISGSTVDVLKQLKPELEYDQVIQAFLRGGYPEPVLAENDSFYRAWMNNYFQTYLQRDIRRLFPRLDITRYRRFIQMLADASSTIINRSDFGRSIDTSEVTIKEYLDIAQGSYIWRNIPSFEKSKSKSILKKPKGILRDSGLVHFLSGVRTREELFTNRYTGNNFEAFIIEELIKGFQADTPETIDYYYYRTKNGAEVDLLLEGPFGLLPIEIKFGATITPKNTSSIQNFVRDNNLPLGLVISNSEKVYAVNEHVINIPAGMI